MSGRAFSARSLASMTSSVPPTRPLRRGRGRSRRAASVGMRDVGASTARGVEPLRRRRRRRAPTRSARAFDSRPAPPRSRREQPAARRATGAAGKGVHPREARLRLRRGPAPVVGDGPALGRGEGVELGLDVHLGPEGGPERVGRFAAGVVAARSGSGGRHRGRSPSTLRASGPSRRGARPSPQSSGSVDRRRYGPFVALARRAALEGKPFTQRRCLASRGLDRVRRCAATRSNLGDELAQALDVLRGAEDDEDGAAPPSACSARGCR